MSIKSQVFLSDSNSQILIKKMYQKHKKDGGTFPVSTFTEQVPALQAAWKQTALLDSYESLLFDPVSEMEAINSDFVSQYWPMFSVGDDFKSIKHLRTPADYHCMDTSSVPDVVTTDEIYRFNNAIPLYQRLPDRHYDRSGEGSGLRGRSIEQTVNATGDMQRLLDRVNQPYHKVDTNDVRYYGQTTDESNDSLTSTVWKTS